jgi:hypothetical protein
LRQRLIKISKQGFIVKVAFKLGAHEKMAASVIDKLVVVDDIQLVLVTDIRDL